jgi:hypothetical protein
MARNGLSQATYVGRVIGAAASVRDRVEALRDDGTLPAEDAERLLVLVEHMHRNAEKALRSVEHG